MNTQTISSLVFRSRLVGQALCTVLSVQCSVDTRNSDLIFTRHLKHSTSATNDPTEGRWIPSGRMTYERIFEYLHQWIDSFRTVAPWTA